MTSTNFNIGMADDPRSSSRVLKPPGGGHSDIFGIYQPQEPRTPKTKNNYPRSTINEVFGNSEPMNNANANHQKERKTEEQIDNQPVVPVLDKALPVLDKPMPVLDKATPQRTRVPPGGFSSGLW